MFTRSNWFDFFDSYLPFVCKKCNKFDWLKATQNGISHTPIFPAKMPDFFQTSDMRAYVVSTKTRIAIEDFSDSIAVFFTIPKIKDHFVLLPKQLLYRPNKVVISDEYLGGVAFRSTKPVCQECKMYDLGFRRRLFNVPDDIVFGGIVLDTIGMTLVASREFSDHLRKAKLTGMDIAKDAFANPKK